MKNVRLFAVAAAMGMFASTVSAASAVKYDVKWNSAQGNAIKIDLNDTIVAPVVTADVTKMVTSTSGTASKACTTADGAVNEDHNLDGLADTVFYNMDNSYDWYFTDVKYTSTPMTMKYYLGLGDGSYQFGRILAPGAAAVNGYIDATTHKLYTTAEELETRYNEILGLTDNEGEKLVTLTTDADGFDWYHIDSKNLKPAHEDTDKNDALWNTDYKVGTFYEINDDAPLGYYTWKVVLNGAEHFGDDMTDVLAACVEDPTLADPSHQLDTALLDSLVKGTKGALAGLKAFEKTGRVDKATSSYLVGDVQTYITGALSYNKTGVANDSAKTALLDYASGYIAEETLLDEIIVKSTTPHFNTTPEDMYLGSTWEQTDLAAAMAANKYYVFANADEYEEAVAGNGASVVKTITLTGTDETDYAFTGEYYIVGRRGALDVENPTTLSSADIATIIDGLSKNELLALRAGTVLVVDEELDAKTSIEECGFVQMKSFSTDYANGRAYDYIWNEDEYEFEKVERSAAFAPVTTGFTTTAAVNSLIDTFGGVYKVDTEANKTDKYIVDANLGVYNKIVANIATFDDEDDYVSLIDYRNLTDENGDVLDTTQSKTKETLSYYNLPTNWFKSASNTNPYTISYIDIDPKRGEEYLPAFDTAEEAVQYLAIMAGVNMADSDFIDVLEPYANMINGLGKLSSELKPTDVTDVKISDTNESYWAGYAVNDVVAGDKFGWGSFKTTAGNRTDIDGTKYAHVPTNLLDHYSAKPCVYTAGAEAVDASQVVVSNNVAEIDTTVAGVKTLTYTAKVGETVVGTYDMTVVVAPKYVRTWEGGKVKTLTSFYLDGTTKYAFYDYNWSAKTVTITYYNTDGSVSTTVTNAL